MSQSRNPAATRTFDIKRPNEGTENQQSIIQLPTWQKYTEKKCKLIINYLHFAFPHRHFYSHHENIYVFRFRFLLVALVAAAAIPDGKAISFDATLSGSAMPAVSFSKTNQAFEPVIFSAVRASEKSRKSVSRLAFDNTVTDIGYGWNPKRSEFVCFNPGSYFFSFTAISDSTSNFKSVVLQTITQWRFH